MFPNFGLPLMQKVSGHNNDCSRAHEKLSWWRNFRSPIHPRNLRRDFVEGSVPLKSIFEFAKINILKCFIAFQFIFSGNRKPGDSARSHVF